MSLVGNLLGTSSYTVNMTLVRSQKDFWETVSSRPDEVRFIRAGLVRERSDDTRRPHSSVLCANTSQPTTASLGLLSQM